MAYHVFICHSYGDRSIYYELVQKLNDAKRFKWFDLSVPYNMRFGIDEEETDDAKLRADISAKIELADVFLVLTKPVASRRRWLQFEILLAKDLGKPIIGIARYRKDSVSSFVRRHAVDIVDTWRIEHIINAIREYGDAYHAQATRKASSPVSASLPQEAPDEPLPPHPSPLSPEELAEESTEPQRPLSPRELLYRAIRDHHDDPVPQPISKAPIWWRAPGRDR